MREYKISRFYHLPPKIRNIIKYCQGYYPRSFKILYSWLHELVQGVWSPKIQFILGYVRNNDKNGGIVKVALGCAQKEVGISKFFLNCSYQRYHHVTKSSWINELFSFLGSFNVTFEYDEAWIPPKTFINDVNLIEYMVSQNTSPTYSRSTINDDCTNACTILGV